MQPSDRRRKLIYILSVKGLTTIKKLAEELEVSERTILRDINILSESYPIGTLTGKHGGAYLVDTYVLNRPCLSEQEIQLLEKIAFDIEVNNCSRLTIEELGLLKKMITNYSKPKKKRG